jgi:hypothetical protein
MWGLRLSRKFTSMHPTLMTMIATDRAIDLRCAADERRRGRQARAAYARRFPALRIPRRAARIAHA